MPGNGNEGDKQGLTGGTPADPSTVDPGGKQGAQSQNGGSPIAPPQPDPASDPESGDDEARKWRELSRKHEKQENKYRSELDRLTDTVNQLQRDNAILKVKSQYPALTDEDLESCDADTADGVQAWADRMASFLERHNGGASQSQPSSTDPLQERLKKKGLQQPPAQSVADFKKQLEQRRQEQRQSQANRFHF